jgi:hypothetical protein
VEGVFDLLTLRMWGYPVVGLVGSHTRPDLLDQLRTFARLYVVLDNDDAGVEATLGLVQELGKAAGRLPCPMASRTWPSWPPDLMATRCSRPPSWRASA